MAQKPAEKTAWEHVLGEPVVAAPGERPMKAEVNAKFDGSMKDFVEWMAQTFKNPDDMRVRVVIGSFAADEAPAKAVEHKTYSELTQKLHKMSKAAGGNLKLDETEDAITKIKVIAHQNGKINAIKWLREAASIGLKEAKDFVEALPPYEEEIPF
jgi:ribosomal protein L7/L12